MKTLKLTIPLIAIILCLTTCKRYPEGGWTNVAIKHLFGGHKTGSSKTWHLKKYEVNGIDSTMFITPGNGYTSFENDLITFKNGPGSDDEAITKIFRFNVSFYNNKNEKHKMKTKMSYTGNTKDRSFTSQYFDGVYERKIFNPNFEYPAPEWNIIKLSNNELIISISSERNNYKIVLSN